MTFTKCLLYLLAALLIVALAGAARARAFLAREPAPLVGASFAAAPPAPSHAPERPTVAVVLGADVTEITDMLGPYEMFARTGRFNVYAVAPSKSSTTLTGGLRIRPHYSFDELDRLLDGRSPAVVVAPNVPNIESAENRSVVEWVRRSAESGATSLSWCAGAAVLAEAGLLDGRPATSHWGDLARLEKDYPAIDWKRGVRWVDDGNVLTSAGITSGIDATLRLLVRLEGEGVARRVAEELRYPNFRFVVDPRVEQYIPRVSDGVLLLNAAFQPIRRQIGLALYDGVGELDVSTVYDAHAAAAVADVHALAARADLVQTAHGLWLEPALIVEGDPAGMRALHRIIVPGRDALTLGAALARELVGAGTPPPEYVHTAGPERFNLEPVLEDLARSADLATATFAQRRLEYRSASLRMLGNAHPIGALLAPFLLAAVGAVLLAIGARLVRRATARSRLRELQKWQTAVAEGPPVNDFRTLPSTK